MSVEQFDYLVQLLFAIAAFFAYHKGFELGRERD